tara:strand:- start:44 stop:451 length:408 start_codon:yes stop_codon:yes gene_type:complete
MNIKETIQLLGIQDVTTKRQKKNGTITWRLPIKKYGKFIEVGSFKSGYVRNNNSGYCNYQLNNKKKINSEQKRLEYLITYCLKNYYINQANMIEDGKFVPKWKYEVLVDEYKNRVNEVNNPKVKVIVNGHRYNIT